MHYCFDFIPTLRHHIMVIFSVCAVAKNGRCRGIIPILPIMGVGGEQNKHKENFMKKIISLAVASAAITTSAMAANMENPLFLPSAGDVYSKTSIGLMYKITDSTDNQELRNHDGEVEFPIWRPVQELGVGITDRWAVHGAIGYTYDGDIDRKGFHLGRLGTTYRVIKSLDGYVWDLYGDLHMGGIEKMKGSLNMVSPGKFVFNYDNYSNGRWGAHVGTKFGRTWSNLTASIFGEVLRTWGNHNNEINVSELAAMLPGLPDKLSVDIKSTWEVNAGANIFYQMTNRWSGGLGFQYKYHATNGLEGVYTDLPAAIAPTVEGMLAEYKDMKDHFNEYAITLTLAYQLRDGAQVAWYIEDTLDTGARLSANTTDVKIETGFRVNFLF